MEMPFYNLKRKESLHFTTKFHKLQRFLLENLLSSHFKPICVCVAAVLPFSVSRAWFFLLFSFPVVSDTAVFHQERKISHSSFEVLFCVQSVKAIIHYIKLKVTV